MDKRMMPNTAQAIEDAGENTTPPTLEACREAFNAGQLETSRKLCRALLKQEPENAEATNILGVIQMRKGNLQVAEQLFARALKLDPENPKIHINLGVLYQESDRLPQAVQHLQKALAIDGTLFQPHQNLGSLYLKQKDYARAESHFRQAIHLRDDVELKLENALAEALTRQGKPEDAIERAKTLLKQGEQVQEISQMLYSLFLEQGDEQTARDNLDRVLRSVEDKEASTKTLALTYLHRNELEAAQRTIEGGLKKEPDNAEYHNILGSIHVYAERYHEGLAEYDKAIALDPRLRDSHRNKIEVLKRDRRRDDVFDALETFKPYAERAEWEYYYGKTLYERQRYQEAADHFNLAIAEDKDFIDAYAELARTWALMGDVIQATRCLELALERDPDHVPCLINMAALRADKSRKVLAWRAINHALEIEPNNIDAHCMKASLLLGDGKLEEAMEECNWIIERSPGSGKGIATKAQILEKSARYEEAYELFQQLPKRRLMEESNMLASYSAVLESLKKFDELIAVVTGAMKNKEFAPRQKQPLYFRLGNVYDKRKEYDQAFAYYLQGNSQKQVTLTREKDWKTANRIIHVFSREKIKEYPRAEHGSDLPVYIVGMPRSGTTLTEQILDSHPQVTGAGELDFIRKITVRMQEITKSKHGFPGVVQLMDQQKVNGFGEKLMEELQAFNPQARHIVDKMPHNFQALGIIQMLAPKAKVIHCMRHPLDNLLSCFFQNFTSGHEYSFRLELMADHYACYRRIMAHWREVLELPMLEVQYEETVGNPEAQVRRILDFLDLEWDDACLDFHKSKRYVATASYNQVRQPIYKTSDGKWKRYEKHLQPVTDRLLELDVITEADLK